MRLFSTGIILGCIFFIPLSAGQAPLQKLLCADGPSRFLAVLDPNDYEKGSGFFKVKEANVFHNYSSARLICEGNVPDKLRCIGYWIEQDNEIAQATTFTQAKELRVRFLASKAYKNIRIDMKCTISAHQ